MNRPAMTYNAGNKTTPRRANVRGHGTEGSNLLMHEHRTHEQHPHRETAHAAAHIPEEHPKHGGCVLSPRSNAQGTQEDAARSTRTHDIQAAAGDLAAWARDHGHSQPCATERGPHTDRTRHDGETAHDGPSPWTAPLELRHSGKSSQYYRRGLASRHRHRAATCGPDSCTSCAFCEGYINGSHEHDHFPIPAGAGGEQWHPICLDCHDLKDRIGLFDWTSPTFSQVIMELPAAGRLALSGMLGDLLRLGAENKALWERLDVLEGRTR